MRVEDFLEPAFESLLLLLSKRLRTTKMHVEGLLSEVRAALPKSKQAPNSEKLAYLGYLSQVMKDHLAAG